MTQREREREKEREKAGERERERVFILFGIHISKIIVKYRKEENHILYIYIYSCPFHVNLFRAGPFCLLDNDTLHNGTRREGNLVSLQMQFNRHQTIKTLVMVH